MQEVPARRAHVDPAEVAVPPRAQLCSLRSPCRRRGDGTDPRQEVLGKSPWRQSKPTLFSSGFLIFFYLFVFESAITGPLAELGSCKERGCGPRCSTLGRAWPGGERHQGMAGCRRKREATWGAAGSLSFVQGPAARGRGAAP